MWLRCPCSSCRPSASRMPSDVPNSAASVSCTPSALPLSSACTNPPRISAAKPCTPPVCTTTGPATATTFNFCSSVCRISAAVCRTAVSTCRSDEIPFDMNANASRSRSFDSGATRIPRIPTTTRSPAFMSRRRRHHAASVRHHDQRVHALVLDFDPLLLVPHERAVIGRRIKILRRAAIALHRPQRGIARIHRRAAELQQVCAAGAPSTRSMALPPSVADTMARYWCGRCETVPPRSGRDAPPPCRRCSPSRGSRSGGLPLQPLPVDA